MKELQESTAYRAFRVTAYRHKYEPALLYGGRSFSYGDLLNRVEYTYNSLRQLGVEPGDRVALWLPDCPDLLACFYALSRLGAVPVLCYGESTPCELGQILLQNTPRLLITTPQKEDALRQEGVAVAGSVVLCRPELDQKGGRKKSKPLPGQEHLHRLEALREANRYNANDPPAQDPKMPAVILYGTSCFVRCTPIVYLGEELGFTAAVYARHRELIKGVFVENSFATEGGFLTVHSALCNGVQVLWCLGEPWAFLKKNKPDYLVATEEFFWALRQKTDLFRGDWTNLQGGIQIGKEQTPLMTKFAAKAFERMGGRGVLAPLPVPLKVRKEELYFVKDFGLRLADLEQDVCTLEGVVACRCIPAPGGIRLRLQVEGKNGAELTQQVLDRCRRRWNLHHLPDKVEFGPIN